MLLLAKVGSCEMLKDFLNHNVIFATDSNQRDTELSRKSFSFQLIDLSLIDKVNLRLDQHSLNFTTFIHYGIAPFSDSFETVSIVRSEGKDAG